MASRSVRWRSPALPPVRNERRFSSSRSRICGAVSSLTRAAASSIASGMPSSRRQISATAEAFWLFSSNDGLASRARSTNICTAADAASASEPTGKPSGGTAYSRSSRTWSGARLVAISFRFGASVSTSPSSGDAGITCSKLSSTISVGVSPMRSPSVSAIDRSCASRTPSASAIAEPTSFGSLIGARSTKYDASNSSAAAARPRARDGSCRCRRDRSASRASGRPLARSPSRCRAPRGARRAGSRGRGDTASRRA